MKSASVQNLENIKAALLVTVILSHVSAITLPSLSQLSDLSLAVIVTFILKGIAAFGREAAYLFVLFSGFATAHHYQNSAPMHKARSLGKRLLRLYPPYLYALTLTMVLDRTGFSIVPSYYLEVFPFPYIPTDNDSLSTLACNVAMLQPTLCQSFGTNGPLWTIGYLMQFYLFAWILRTVTPNVTMMLILGGLIALLALFFLRMEWAALFGLWTFGMLLRGSLGDWALRVPGAILTTTILICVLTAKLGGPLWSVVFMAPVGAALVLLAEREWGAGPHWIEGSLAWFRRNAFFLYLLHMPVLAALAAAVTTAVGPVKGSPFAFIALSALTVFLSACSIAVYKRAETLIFDRGCK